MKLNTSLKINFLNCFSRLSTSIEIGITLISFYGVVFPKTTHAQILPDTTLPNNSIVEMEGSSQRITGGTIAGENLFHSFQEFNLDTGSTAYFENALTIDNIITRVTGGTISHIDGILRANGSANLFLLNPSGILFGPNAQLDIGGSFLGSTAEQLLFEDGSAFSATDPDGAGTPLLSVNVPIGLQLGPNPGSITIEGPGHRLSSAQDPTSSPLESISHGGLQVKPGRTLALIGGNVTLDGGLLTAPSGRIDIGSAIEGRVNLSATAVGWRLDYPEDVGNFGDIQLSDAALLDASGGGSSGIQLAGRHITLADGSLAFANTQSALAGGDIRVRASESIEIYGTDPNGISGGLRTQTIGPGDSGAIAISTPSLTLEGGARIYSVSFGAGNSGDISINATNSVELIGASPLRRLALSAITSNTFEAGDGGDVTLSTSRLSIRDGGALLGITRGTGSGGDVVVRATDSVEVVGFNRARPGTNTTRSALSAATQGAGDGGNTTIETGRLRVLDGGRVVATTLASGAGGGLTVNASESIEVSGVNERTSLPSTLSSDAQANLPIQRILGLPPIPSGEPGTVILNTPRLSISESGRVGVDNQGLGNGGDMRITAEAVFLDSGGRIAASSASGEGGNLFVQVGDVLQLRRNSQITAEAGNRGNGGNISIEANTLVALENSDITANAQAGFGGRVRIATSGIFGTQFRDFQTPQSDITATSELGAEFSGVVDIQTPDVDTSSGLVTLPDNVVDVTALVGQDSCTRGRGSSFTVTGRGGLPPNPTDELPGEATWVDLRSFAHSTTQTDGNVSPPMVWRDWQDFSSATETTGRLPVPMPQSSPPLEATGWILNDAGEVELIATHPSGNNGGAWGERSSCQSRIDRS